MGAKTMTNEEFTKVIEKMYPNILLLTPYVNSKTKITAKCLIDECIWTVYPRTLKEKGCPKCYGSVTKHLTDEEYKIRLLEINKDIELVDLYKSMNTKVLHRCKKHNKLFLQTPKNALEGKCGCEDCKKEKNELNGKNKRTSDANFKKQLFDKYGDEFIPLEPYVTSGTKIKFLHNIKNGEKHTFYSTPNSLLRGEGCGTCKGLQVCVGYNDLNTIFPEISKYLLNYEDGYNVTPYSGKEIFVKCPYCGYIKKTHVRDLTTRKFSCPVCSDGISYPNKFIFNMLLQIKNELDFLKREWSPDWLKFKINNKNKTGKYDIYFGYNNKAYVIEMDGGLGHGNREYHKTKEESLEIDNKKDELAQLHNIKVIRIDCNYKQDPYDYIKNNILKSELNQIIDLSKINFEDANLKSRNSYVIKAVELWEEGYTVSEIGDILNLYQTTITNYLVNMAKINKCSYTKEESKYRSMGHKIICLNDRKIFPTIVEASKFYNIEASAISKCCRRKSTFGGWYNNKKMIFMYLSEYNKLSEEEINNYIPKENNIYVKVVCLDTKQVFNMAKDAAIWSGQKTSGGIIACCNGRYNVAGKHPEYHYPLHWAYYENYINMTDDEINNIINYKSTGWKKVICLNDLTAFDNATIAANWCGMKNKLVIQSCCRNELKYAGLHPITGEELKWMYYKDYLKLNNEKVMKSR